MNTAQPIDIGALDKWKGKEKDKDEKGWEKGKQPGRSPRGKATENPELESSVLLLREQETQKT